MIVSMMAGSRPDGKMSKQNGNGEITAVPSKVHFDFKSVQLDTESDAGKSAVQTRSKHEGVGKRLECSKPCRSFQANPPIKQL
jgi:hypothetical protein